MKSFEIKLTPNYSARTFTIRKIYSDGFKIKYRTAKQSDEDFESIDMNYTKKDLQHLINNRSECYKVQSYYNNLK